MSGEEIPNLTFLFDPEIERTLHRRLRERRAMEGNGNDDHNEIIRQRGGNEDNRPMCEYFMPTVDGVAPSIAWPAVQANNFELKSALIQMVQVNQFGGGALEDPHAHLMNFLHICATIKSNGVSNDAIRLLLFPFSLRDKARSWLHSLPPQSLTSWN